MRRRAGIAGALLALALAAWLLWPANAGPGVVPPAPAVADAPAAPVARDTPRARVRVAQRPASPERPADEPTPTAETDEPQTAAEPIAPGLSLSGRVRTSDGRSPVGATIYVLATGADVTRAFRTGTVWGRGPHRGVRLTILGRADAGIDGRFVIDDLPTGPYDVAVEMLSRVPAARPGMVNVVCEVRLDIAAGTDDLLLTVPADGAPPAHALDIVVSDADGAPITRCDAVAESGSERLPADLVSAGLLHFGDMPPGVWRIRVSGEGFLSHVEDAVRIGGQGRREPLRVTLRRGAVFRGRVTVADGEFPKGAKLVVRRAAGTARGEVHTAAINADGSFEVAGLADGRHEVAVVKPRSPFGAGAVFVPRDGPTIHMTEALPVTRDLVLVKGGELEVSFREPRLPPAPGATGSHATDEQERRGRESYIEVRDESGALRFRLSPLRSSTYALLYVAPGDYVVRVAIDGGEFWNAQVTVKEHERARPLLHREE